MLLPRNTLLVAIVACLRLYVCAYGQDKEIDLEQYAKELSGITHRRPACLVDEHGLPNRVIINRNGAGMFEEPKPKSKRTRTLSLYDRLYLYVDDTGVGF